MDRKMQRQRMKRMVKDCQGGKILNINKPRLWTVPVEFFRDRCYHKPDGVEVPALIQQCSFYADFNDLEMFGEHEEIEGGKAVRFTMRRIKLFPNVPGLTPQDAINHLAPVASQYGMMNDFVTLNIGEPQEEKLNGSERS